MDIQITPRTVAILSIHDKYATAIYEGYKRYEVRKTSIKVQKIYLYETKPIGLVTGYIVIGNPIKVSIPDIINKYLHDTFLTPKQIMDYAKGKPTLYLWPIKEAHRIDPFKLYPTIPQSFTYTYEQSDTR